MKLLPRYLQRHRKDDDAPYVLGGAAGVFVLVIVSLFALAGLTRYALTSENLAAVIASVLTDLVNGDRADNELSGLAWSPVLAKAAEAKALDMASKGYFAHTSPEGFDSWHWFRQAGYSFTYAGENLAVNFSDSVAVEVAWMNSPSHRANILHNRYTEIGIATADGFYQGRPTTFVVQLFGKPAHAKVPLPTPQAISKAPSAFVLGATADSAAWWEHLIASPKTALSYAYYALGALILLFLLYLTRFEFKHHHQRHVVAAALLLVLMAGLFAFSKVVFFTEPVLASGL